MSSKYTDYSLVPKCHAPRRLTKRQAFRPAQGLKPNNRLRPKLRPRPSDQTMVQDNET